MERKTNKQVSLNSNQSNSNRADARERNRIMKQNEHNPYVLVKVSMGRKAPYREKVLMILSRQREGAATVAKLFAMSQYSNPTQFRNSVLLRLQQLDFVYYDRVARTVKLTRLGWLVASHANL